MLRQELSEFIKKTPVTVQELECSRQWIKDGNSVYSNPRWYADDNGREMNYVDAMLFDAALPGYMKEQALSGGEWPFEENIECDGTEAYPF